VALRFSGCVCSWVRIFVILFRGLFALTAETQITQPPRNEVESRPAPLPRPEEPTNTRRTISAV